MRTTFAALAAVLLFSLACSTSDSNVPDRFSYERHVARRPGNSIYVWVVRDHQTEQCYMSIDLDHLTGPIECTSGEYVQPPAEAE